jgi:putative membrane protein
VFIEEVGNVMKQWMRFGGVMALALVATACAGDDARTTNETAATPAARDNATAGTTGDADQRADQEFVRKQLAVGTHEIELGQLAQQKGTHPEVKRFGEMMVRDHQTAGQELREILSQTTAGTAGETARENADNADDHRETVEDLQKLSGAEFDKKYIDQMVDDHQKAIDEVENKAENANNPAVKQWASKTLPKMQQHLERAKTIKETLDNAGR